MIEPSTHPDEPAKPEVHDLLHRILKAVERDSKRGGLEFVLVIILSVTALGSTWCAYQSQLWNGVQLALLSDQDVAEQDSHSAALARMQHEMMDSMIVVHYVEAIERNDTALSTAIYKRMDSPLRETIDAWLALDPFHNPDVVPPRKMPQYVLPEIQAEKTASDLAKSLGEKANAAGNNGDTYVLLTLMFASVLFFGGITGTFDGRRVRLMLTAITLVMFTVTVLRVATMPVCSG